MTWGTALLCAAGGVQAQPVITGNAEVDFRAGSLTIPDPNGVDVHMPPPFPVGLVSGNDLKDVRFQYLAATDTMYVAFNTYGVATDVDGDGDASNTGPILAALGGIDLPRIGGTEAAVLLVDVDEDGIFDVTIGVSGETDVDGFAVTRFAGDPFKPALAFGKPLPGLDGTVLSNQEAKTPDLSSASLTGRSCPAPDRTARCRSGSRPSWAPMLMRASA